MLVCITFYRDLWLLFLTEWFCGEKISFTGLGPSRARFRPGGPTGQASRKEIFHYLEAILFIPLCLSLIFFFWSLFKWHLSSIRNWPIAKKSSGQDNHTCWFGHEYLFFQMRFGPFGLLRSLWHHRVTYIISSVRSLADWWVVGLLGHNLLIHTVCPILYS